MKWLKIIIFLCLGFNSIPANSQNQQPEKLSIRIQLGGGNALPPQSRVQTIFIQEPAQMSVSDFPTLSIGPSFTPEIGASYQLSNAWNASIGIALSIYRLKGRVGALGSRMELPFKQYWLSPGIPFKISYTIPIRRFPYNLRAGIGIIPAWYFLGSTSYLTYRADTGGNALRASFDRFKPLNISYKLSLDCELPLKKNFLLIGIEAIWAIHAPIKLDIIHYTIENPTIVITGPPKPEEMSYQYYQFITPNQIQAYFSFPIFSK